jgi:hypothetical protein
MQRTLNRAYQRLQGNHPRRPPSWINRAIETVLDLLFFGAILVFLGGIALIVWSLAAGFEITLFSVGLALLVLGPVLLLLWERVGWEPVAKRFSKLT